MEITNSVSTGEPRLHTAPDSLQVLDGMVSTLEISGARYRQPAGVAGTYAGHGLAAGRCNERGRGTAGSTVGALDSRSAELAQRAVAAEIATATRANDRTVQRQMGQAVELLERFPVTFQALAQGRISLAHARVIQDVGTVLESPVALFAYESAVVACAQRQAPGRVRRLAVREAEKAQHEPFVSRHQRAAEERLVRVAPMQNGMAELSAVLPVAVALGIYDRLTQMARAHTTASRVPGVAGAPRDLDAAGTLRNIDQLRADLLSDVLLTGAPLSHDTPDGFLAAIQARVDVTIPVVNLVDASGNVTGETDVRALQVPADVDGKYLIDPAAARALAGQTTAWNRVLTDRFTGAVLAVDRYRPSEDLKRMLKARDTRCRFPGCGIKARDLDLDHSHDAALGGTTDTGNLAGLCRRHHVLKHHSPWKIHQTGGGVLEWTSPAGRKYTDHPPTLATYRAATDSQSREPGHCFEPQSIAAPPPF